MRLHVNGSSIGVAARGGIVLRNLDGEVIFVAANFFWEATNVYAEILASEHGLHICIEQGFKEIHIDIDSLLFINMLNGSASKPWRYNALLDHISTLFQTTGSFWRHQFWKVNTVANTLVKLASSSGYSLIFQQYDLPSHIESS